MKHSTFFYQIIYLCFIILVSNSCEKTDVIGIDSANFTVTSETLYLDEECTFTAEDTIGGKNYKWDFGDETTLKAGHKVSHQYTKRGMYTVVLQIDGKYQSKTIEVLPGRISYQIVNESNYDLPDILIYLDNYEAGCTKRLNAGIRPRSETSPIYATSTIYTRNAISHSHAFGISFFIKNSEFTFYNNNINIDDFNHNIITITDETKLTKRRSNGADSEYYSLAEAGAVYWPEE